VRIRRDAGKDQYHRRGIVAYLAQAFHGHDRAFQCPAVLQRHFTGHGNQLGSGRDTYRHAAIMLRQTTVRGIGTT
jgi:hypothetical protein